MGFHLFDCFQPPTFPRKRQYKLGRIIGQGTYGVVREAVAKHTQRSYAIKVISKSLLPHHAPHFLQREICSLQSLHHPNIVRFIEHFESKKHHYLVCEMAKGGELFNRILNQGHFTERNAAELMYQIVHAIAEAHRCGIVHRDLKPENVLFRSKEESSELVIADFGVSRMVSDDEVLFTVCGSPGYCAPEILLSKGHGKACDMWSIGVITYTILCGYSPFGPIDNPRNLMKRMMSGTIEFHERYWQLVSDDAKDFIRCLLQLNPDDRMTADEALKHPWLQSCRLRRRSPPPPPVTTTTTCSSSSAHLLPSTFSSLSSSSSSNLTLSEDDDSIWVNLLSEDVRHQLSTRHYPFPSSLSSYFSSSCSSSSCSSTSSSSSAITSSTSSTSSSSPFSPTPSSSSSSSSSSSPSSTSLQQKKHVTLDRKIFGDEYVDYYRSVKSKN